MSPKRTDEISVKLRPEAKQIYDNLPAKGKGEWVSDAIIEKAERNTIPITEDRVRAIVHEELEKRRLGK